MESYNLSTFIDLTYGAQTYLLDQTDGGANLTPYYLPMELLTSLFIT